VIAEYFFEQPEVFRSAHPELNGMLDRIFGQKK
jgi:Mlc titration factor MtfA (ptsG expression regulator)